jgi:hypothetical protein
MRGHKPVRGQASARGRPNEWSEGIAPPLGEIPPSAPPSLHPVASIHPLLSLQHALEAARMTIRSRAHQLEPRGERMPPTVGPPSGPRKCPLTATVEQNTDTQGAMGVDHSDNVTGI